MFFVRALAAVAGLCAFAATNAVASPCPGTNEITDPADFQWTYHPADASNPEPYYSGTMEIREETFDINGDTLTTRAYAQEGMAASIPAPTMNMVPGNKYVLSFHNQLPYEVPSTSHNVFKDPNISNLHTHGLHISGESPGDDVTRSFEGGFGGDFVYDVPTDHMGGTFWYHAHHHGSTMLQVAGGAFGLLVVDDSNDGIPASVAAMDERELLVAYLDPGVAGTGGDTLMSGSLGATWTVNGKVGGNICTAPGEWEHWRLLLADKDAKPKNVTVGAGCEVQLLGRDGVWRTTAPKAIGNNTLNLTGASRADIAVKCTGDSDIKVGNATVANIYVDGTNGNPSAMPWDGSVGNTWSASRPSYLRSDLSDQGSVNTETVRLGARTVNGSKFDPDVANYTLPADSVQDWSVSGAGQHPFHLHIYHVQAWGCGGDYEDGEYYDVVASSCDVRFDMSTSTGTPYDGRTIMHCHILEHEDQGAMGWMDVVGGASAPTFPADQGGTFGEYYALSAPPATIPADPSALAATATSSSNIDLAWADNSNDEDGFDIERSLDGSSWSAYDSVAANATSYSDGGLDPLTTYWYRVSAFNSAGASGYTNEASDTTFDQAFIPNAPSALVASATGTSTIDLSWADNSANEDGFDVERRIQGGGFSVVGSVGADSTSYNDSGLQASTTYEYQVTAYNTAGSSTPSNIASDTTDDPAAGTSVVIGSLTVTTASAGRGTKRGEATIVVQDDQGNVVNNATVTGDFSGTISESGLSGVTDGSGSVTLSTSGTAKGSVNLTFCVTSITHPTLADWSGSSCASN